jgi:hypothetical protein
MYPDERVSRGADPVRRGRRARRVAAPAALAQTFRPTGCNFTPIWGNALNYRIGPDQ